MYSNNDYRSYALYHHGIRGQKWGVRRYQNSDGTLTAAGRKRLASQVSKSFNSNPVTRAFGGASDFRKGLDELKKNETLINASKHLKTIYKEADKAQKELDKAKNNFINDKKTYNEYLTKTAERNISEYKNEMRKRRDDAKPSKAEMDEYISGIRAYYKNGKGEFAEATAWENYVSDHKDAQDLKYKAEKSYSDFRRACRNATNELLQEYSKVPVNYIIAGYKMRHTADLLVTDALTELAKMGK